MLNLLFLPFLLSIPLFASVVGVSTHPLNEEARVFSAEMTGYMSQRNEMGGGIRYTQEIAPNRLLDFSLAGGQNSRGLIAGGGMDLELLHEDVNQPRVSIKPYIQQQKFETSSFSSLGAAPAIRKGFSLNGTEFFPYLAFPSGIKIDSTTDKFVYYASMSFGASMPFPGARNKKILLSVEGNKNMGAAADYVGALVSWMWK